MVFIKPDGIQRCLVGSIITRFEQKGLKLAAIKMMHVDEQLANVHYEAHKDKWFFDRLVKYITSGPIVLMIWQGDGAICAARAVIGPTDSLEAPPGTIRGDFAMSVSRNIMHASDSAQSAEREIALFFSGDELFDYPRAIDDWV